MLLRLFPVMIPIGIQVEQVQLVLEIEYALLMLPIESNWTPWSSLNVILTDSKTILSF